VKTKLKGFFTHAYTLVFTTCLLVFLLGLIPGVDLIEKHLLDLSFRIRGAETPHEAIVIIEIDETSIRSLGTWPWPRSYHAALLSILNEHKPSSIFYDVVFAESSAPAEDDAFSEALGKSGNVVLPFYFVTDQVENFDRQPMVLPLEIFRAASGHLGYVNFFPDQDGHVRDMQLAVKRNDQWLTHSSLATVSRHLGWSEEALIPFFRKRVKLNIPGPYENFNRISFLHILAIHEGTVDDVSLDFLKDKVVLVGFTAAGIAIDHKPSPFSPLYPGVGIQASMMHTLLSGKYIHTIPQGLKFFLLLIFAFIALRLSRARSPQKALLAMLAALCLTFLLVQAAFIYFRVWIPCAGLLMTGTLVFLGSITVQFIKGRLEKEILSRELSLAHNIQTSFLPTKIPEIDGLDVAAYSLPTKSVGGDLYDIIPLSETHWGFSVGDVSGKGVPAALFMAKMVSEFRREAKTLEPKVTIEQMNNKVSEENTSGLFLTLCYLIIQPATKTLTYSSAGHEPILWFQAESKTVFELINDIGTPIGFLPGTPYDQKQQVFKSGDIVFLMSDGVREAMNAKREIFGIERCHKALKEAPKDSAQAVVDHILETVKTYVREAAQHDDLTIMCFKFI